MALSRKNFLKVSALASFGGFSLASSKPVRNSLEGEKKLIKPRVLKHGDTIGLIAPASPIYEQSDFNKMLEDIRGLGFRIKLGQHVQKRNGYLAGSDTERAQDVMDMFEDPEVNGIICTRGGWGSNRILEHLNFDLVRKNPKVFCGFSDITSLHMAFYTQSGLHTFHGPVGKSVWNDYTTNAFRQVLEQGEKPQFRIPRDADESFTITAGNAKGKLLGGNLSVLVSMIGSDYLPSFEDSILFLEDIGESVYRIDRMLTQLKMAGILDQLSGFIFGKCTDCSAGENSLSLNQVFEDHISPLGIPAFYGAMISHEDNNLTLPIGIRAEMDTQIKTIRLLEPAVIT
jgi:muramoyltetrapeptide carboxypeptidase